MIRPLILGTSIAIGWSAVFAVADGQAPQVPSHGAALTTRSVRFAGALTDTAGEALTGLQTVTFTLFDQAEGGTALWNETLTITADDRGRFVVHLGSRTPLPQEVFTTEQARWIETAVDGRNLGRTALVAVPYALKAADADTLGGHAAATYVRMREDGRLETSAGLLSASVVDGTGVPGQITKWAGSTTLGSSVISESASNRVGVGLPDPTGGGVVDSVFTIKNLDNNTGLALLNQTQARRFALNTLGNGGWMLYDGWGNKWNAGIHQLAGYVAIGGGDPLARLTVNNDDATTAAYFVSSHPQGGAAVAASARGYGKPAILGETYGLGATALQLIAYDPGSDLIRGAGSVGNAFRVNNQGQVFAGGYTTGGADFAEEIEPDADGLEPGDLVAIGDSRDRTIVPAAGAYSTHVIGVYSTQPGITGTPYAMDDPRRSTSLPIAMIGIVPCKVSDENGAIQRGDLLVASSTPGRAMKGTDRTRMTGAIVGKALASLEEGTGVILIAVTLQ